MFMDVGRIITTVYFMALLMCISRSRYESSRLSAFRHCLTVCFSSSFYFCPF
ncbi:hypothetical protein BJ165DRAFT_1418449 [Panaeolus papilionaceus]|nr:hypothetical protein BJ165DRAFT_1418449 [Panaeolus papilionaceus]